MDTSKCFMFMRILILTTMAISVAMNAAIIGALVTKRDCKFAELRLPDIFLVLFVLLCFDFSIYLSFNLLWPAITSIDEKICSQVFLENGHGYKVGNKRNPLTDHLLGEFKDTIKTVGIGNDPILDPECETTLQEQVMVFDEQDETFDFRETTLSKTSKDYLGQTIGKETPVFEALHVDPTDSVSCHDSLFLSEDDIARNLNPPYGQGSTSEFHSGKNMFAMMNYLAAEGFANGEVLRDAFSAAEQFVELISMRRKEINDLGQTFGKETPVSEAFHVDTTDSVSCHDSLFLSEDDIARNLIPPYGQASTSEFHSGKNMFAMMNYLAAEGFANGEVVRDAVSASLSQQVAELMSIKRKEINNTVRFRNEYASSMKSKVQGLLFPSHLKLLFPSHLKFADILDDFWGNLFDLHGELTEKGKVIRLDLLIGLDVKDIKSCLCYFDLLPEGLCDPLNLNLGTMSIPPLFRISNDMCCEHGNYTLPAIVAFRRCIMDSFLTEDPSLLKDKEASYFAMRNDQVQYGDPMYKKLGRGAQFIGFGTRLEELNKMEVLVQKCPSPQVVQQASKTNVYFSYNELKGLLLTSFRACILNISGIQGAGWLFENRGGYDEELVDMAFEMVMFGDIHPSGVFCPNAVVDPDGKIFNLCTSTLGCGDGCMWQPTLLISFGIWCISRIFEVLLSAKQPLLFGKYSRVLNRLQGILDPAFLKPVQPFSTCRCTKNGTIVRMPDGIQRINVVTVLEMMKQVEATLFGVKDAEVYGREERDPEIYTRQL